MIKLINEYWSVIMFLITLAIVIKLHFKNSNYEH